MRVLAGLGSLLVALSLSGCVNVNIHLYFSEKAMKDVDQFVVDVQKPGDNKPQETDRKEEPAK